MKILVKGLLALAIISSATVGQSKTLEEYVKEAQDYQNAGKLEQAIRTMEEAVQEYPDNSMAYTHLGQFIGMQAQGMSDFSEIFVLINKAFEMWDKAVSLDPNNFTARFYRGGWGVSMPKFVGKLEVGISDLEFLITVFEKSPDPAAKEQLVSAYSLLGTGYQKRGEFQKAKQVFKKIVEMAPGPSYAEGAQESIDKIVRFEEWQAERNKSKKPDSPEIIELKEKLEKEPDNVGLLIELGKAYFDVGIHEEAEKALRKAINLDPSNAEAYKWLALALQVKSGEGYNEIIAMDTDFRTDLAFETMEVLDKVIALAPEDIEIRFIRGIAGVEMPFFVGKLEQAIDDLEMVIESDAPETTKAEALYWLGVAYQRKAMGYWIKVVSEYSAYEASRIVFDELLPPVKHIDLSQYKSPIVVIDFVLGFQDELPPQTAVWVEDKNGNFVKTIYVSGFSGYAKDTQDNLPQWAAASEFVDVDGVTGASINLGHHIYVWDLKDISGKKVKSGEYVIKVEVSYWPSMKYQMVSTPITLKKEKERKAVEEGDFIPYLEVTYYPKAWK